MTEQEMLRLFADALYDVTRGGEKYDHVPTVRKALAWLKERGVTPSPCDGPGATHGRRPQSTLCGPHYQQLHHHRGDMKKLTPLLLRETPTRWVSAQVPTWVVDALAAADPEAKYMRAARLVYHDLATGGLKRQKPSGRPVHSRDEERMKQIAIKVGDTLAEAVHNYSPRATISVAGAKVLTDWASGALVRRTP
jgi:hypothetical protein